MAVVLVEWSDKPQVSIPWTRISSAEGARDFAHKVRRMSRNGDQFTCLSRMLSFVSDKVLPLLPITAARTVVDVSGDGRDNCNPPVPVDAIRDGLIAEQVTIADSSHFFTTPDEHFWHNVRRGRVRVGRK